MMKLTSLTSHVSLLVAIVALFQSSLIAAAPPSNKADKAHTPATPPTPHPNAQLADKDINHQVEPC